MNNYLNIQAYSGGWVYNNVYFSILVYMLLIHDSVRGYILFFTVSNGMLSNYNLLNVAYYHYSFLAFKLTMRVNTCFVSNVMHARQMKPH